MKRFLLILLMSAGMTPAYAANADVAIALTNDIVEINTSFAGARLTLFGAVTGFEDPENEVDIISVIRGPETTFRIRRLEKKNLIWAPRDAHIIEGAPGLYITNATKPITDIAPLPDQATFNLGADFLNLHAVKTSDNHREDNHDRLFENAFLTEIEDAGLYNDMVGGVSFKKGALFSINVDLPANTPVGDYAVSVYLYRNGVLLGSDTAKLLVNKVGMERRIYDLAQERPVSYGIICVALSLLSGWIAAFAFRK